MWLVSCRMQGMLTQGLTPDPKCKLNISSFLTLPHLSHCLICTRNSMLIVLLLQMVGRWDRWGVVDLEQGVGGETGSGYYLVVFVVVVFVIFSLVLLFFVLSCLLSLCLKWLEHDGSCVCFFVFYFFSLSLVPLTRSYWCIEVVVSVM